MSVTVRNIFLLLLFFLLNLNCFFFQFISLAPVIKVNDVEKTFEGCIVKMRDIKDTAGVAKMKNEQNVLMHFIDSAEFEHTTPKGTEKVQCAATMVLFDKLPEAKKEL